jgi:hypothetical protein
VPVPATASPVASRYLIVLLRGSPDAATVGRVATELGVDCHGRVESDGISTKLVCPLPGDVSAAAAGVLRDRWAARPDVAEALVE